jgi:hypothetical protein
MTNNDDNILTPEQKRIRELKHELDESPKRQVQLDAEI